MIFGFGFGFMLFGIGFGFAIGFDDIVVLFIYDIMVSLIFNIEVKYCLYSSLEQTYNTVPVMEAVSTFYVIYAYLISIPLSLILPMPFCTCTCSCESICYSCCEIFNSLAVVSSVLRPI
jgi:hypothetical protein